MEFEIRVTNNAKSGLDWLEKAGRRAHLTKILELLELLAKNPWINPPPYEKLGGNLNGLISRRVNGRDRLIYEINESQKTITVLAVRGHYDG